MPITINNLTDVGVTPANAAKYIVELNAAMQQYQITDPKEVAAFVAQVLHESSMMRATEEGLSYSSVERILGVFRRLKALNPSTLAALVRNPEKLANAAYANVNGNNQPGDGYLYRGRGLFQLTGKENYTNAANAICQDYVNNPDLVAKPKDACLTAAWFWVNKGCQKCARSEDYAGVTKRINGAAMLGHAEREALRMKLLRSMGVLKA